jgi:hypothetical protein
MAAERFAMFELISALMAASNGIFGRGLFAFAVRVQMSFGRAVLRGHPILPANRAMPINLVPMSHNKNPIDGLFVFL